MKRIFALALVLVMLLASASAWAEENVGTLRFSRLSVSHVDGGRTRTVKFRNISLFLAVGNSDGVPTLQATFDNGEGQVVDAVVQIVGSEVLLSMGGVSGVYAIDLNNYVSGENSGTLIAQGIGSVLSLASGHLDMLLRSVTTEDSKGVRSVEVNMPTSFLIQAAEGLLAVGDGMDAAEDVDLEDLRQRMATVEEEAVLSFRYNEADGAFVLAAMQGNQGMQLSGTVEIGSAPMTLAGVGSEEMKYDLANLDAAVLEQLRGELNLISIKFMHFADGSGLDNIM